LKQLGLFFQQVFPAALQIDATQPRANASRSIALDDPPCAQGRSGHLMRTDTFKPRLSRIQDLGHSPDA